MKRRPLLHVINFLLPILFFLTLDLASFFIADHRGEKLGFKVTVLLAISVLLLILNDILPAMSNKTPLIGTDSCLLMNHTVRRTRHRNQKYRLFLPPSDLLHCDFCSDAAQSAGDHLGYASYGQRLCLPGEALAEGWLQGRRGENQLGYTLSLLLLYHAACGCCDNPAVYLQGRRNRPAVFASAKQLMVTKSLKCCRWLKR